MLEKLRLLAKIFFGQSAEPFTGVPMVLNEYRHTEHR